MIDPWCANKPGWIGMNKSVTFLFHQYESRNRLTARAHTIISLTRWLQVGMWEDCLYNGLISCSMAKAPEIQKVTHNSLQYRSAPLRFHLCTKCNYVINAYQQCNVNKVLHNWHCMSFVKVLSYSPCCSYMDRECGTLVDHSQYMVTVLDIGLSSAHPCCMQ